MTRGKGIRWNTSILECFSVCLNNFLPVKFGKNFVKPPVIRQNPEFLWIYLVKLKIKNRFLDKFQNLDILTCGTYTYNSAEFLASNILKNILLELENSYDVIFIDSTPIHVTTIARIIGSLVDGTLLVVKRSKTSRKELLRAKQLLKTSKSNLIGVVLNNIKIEDKYSRYYSPQATED